MKKEGNIKISSENMMPIIKKWLYSDKDIFEGNSRKRHRRYNKIQKACSYGRGG